MPELAKLPRPILRSSASLHSDDGRWQFGKEFHYLLARKPFAQHRLLVGINPMQLKNMFRRIHSNADNLLHGRLPCLRFATTSFWHTDAVGGRPHHQPPAVVVNKAVSHRAKSRGRGVAMSAIALTLGSLRSQGRPAAYCFLRRSTGAAT